MNFRGPRFGAICEECESNKTRLSAGDPLTDGHFYHYRITILLGTLSAWNLFLILRKQPHPKQDFLRSFFNANLKNARIWGESAIPLLLEAALQIEKFGDQIVAENLAVQLIDGITRANVRGGAGIADPYFGPEKYLRILYGLDAENTVEFRGHSYLLQSLVDFLARRWRRNALARWWERITRLQFTTFQPSTDWEWFTWTARTGALQTRFPAERQSWSVYYPMLKGVTFRLCRARCGRIRLLRCSSRSSTHIVSVRHCCGFLRSR